MKRGLPNLVKTLVLAVVLIAIIAGHPFSEQEFGGGFRVCLNFIKNGEGIYNRQPYCNQTPIIYYYGHIIRNLLGDGLLDAALAITTLLLDAAVYVLLRRIVSLEHLQWSFLYDLAFILLIVASSINHLESTIPTAAVLAATYTLFYSTRPNRAFEGGVFIAVAVFSKYTSLLACTCVLLLYLYREGALGGRKRFPTFSFIAVCAPSAVAFGVFNILYPYFLNYTFLSNIYFQPWTTQQALEEMFKMYLGFIPVLIYVIAAIIYAANKRMLDGLKSFYAIVSAAGILFYMCAIIRGNAVFTLLGYYGLPYYPYVLIVLTSLYKTNAKTHALLFTLLIVYPGLQPTPLLNYARNDADRQLYEFRSHADWAFHFIPPQEGQVLIETDGSEKTLEVFLNQFNITTLKKEQIETISTQTAVGAEDPYWAPRIRYLLTISAPHNNAVELTPAEKIIKEKIINGTYSLIIFGPPYWTITTRILNSIRIDGHLTQDANSSLIVMTPTNQEYYLTLTPNSYYLGQNNTMAYSVVIFRDKKQFTQFIDNGVFYYQQNLKKICAESQAVAGSISSIYSQILDRQTPFICQNGGNIEERLKPQKTTTSVDLLIIASVTFLIYATPPRSHKNKKINSSA
ncbi:Uncharacterised protein [uncultured archaeon]|nr:Uncharacterised protein [uncultured archaeon]